MVYGDRWSYRNCNRLVRIFKTVFGEMKRRAWGFIIPILTTVVLLIGVFQWNPSPPVLWGVVIGTGLALIQSALSVGALWWAWKKSYFYWVWGAGIFLRFFVFFGTAYGVFCYTKLSLVATLLALVSATTVFLVVESMYILES